MKKQKEVKDEEDPFANAILLNNKNNTISNNDENDPFSNASTKNPEEDLFKSATSNSSDPFANATFTHDKPSNDPFANAEVMTKKELEQKIETNEENEDPFASATVKKRKQSEGGDDPFDLIARKSAHKMRFNRDSFSKSDKKEEERNN